MAKNKRIDRREGKHGAGSWLKKSGPKAQRGGKAISPAKERSHKALGKARWKAMIPKLIASLAIERGESMDAGEARMALYTTLKVVD